jgi:hypothetical protein
MKKMRQKLESIKYFDEETSFTKKSKESKKGEKLNNAKRLSFA